MSAAQLSRRLDVPANRVTGILNGRRPVTGDTVLRLAHFSGTTPEFWLNLQSLYEIRVAQKKAGGNQSECFPLSGGPSGCTPEGTCPGRLPQKTLDRRSILPYPR